jgi:uncharacterized protein (DUF486 family)
VSVIFALGLAACNGFFVKCPKIGLDWEVVMSVTLQTVVLLALSNVFMTVAWYWHLRGLNDKPWYIAALISWGIALFEYLIQVPANRIGHTQFNMSQLKIMQEVIALSVFVPVAILVLGEPLRWDYVWAALCIVGAMFFMFRSKSDAPEPTEAQSAQAAQVAAFDPSAPPPQVDPR